MSITSDQQRIFDSKPIARMRRFAELLHWRGLQLERLLFTEDDIVRYNAPPIGILVFFCTPDNKFNLQINERPAGDPFTHQATVKAERYGILNIGWHPFTLYEDEPRLIAEATRLAPVLERNQYKNRHWRNGFVREEFVVTVRSRKKLRGGGK